MAGVTGLRWGVLDIDLEPVRGHEQGGQRRCLVVSAEPFHRSGLATVCPITAARTEPRYPGDVAIRSGHGGQTKDAIILCDQPRTVSLERVRRPLLGHVTDARLRASVRRALGHHFWLDRPDEDDGAAP